MKNPVKPIPSNLQNPTNEQVLNYLKDFSCHGDIVEPLEAILNNHPEVHFFCPDTLNFKYSCWYKDDVIFAYGIGMSPLGFRLPPTKVDIPGLSAAPDAGPDWYEVHWMTPNLKELVDAALAFVDESV